VLAPAGAPDIPLAGRFERGADREQARSRRYKQARCLRYNYSVASGTGSGTWFEIGGTIMKYANIALRSSSLAVG